MYKIIRVIFINFQFHVIYQVKKFGQLLLILHKHFKNDYLRKQYFFKETFQFNLFHALAIKSKFLGIDMQKMQSLGQIYEHNLFSTKHYI